MGCGVWGVGFGCMLHIRIWIHSNRSYRRVFRFSVSGVHSSLVRRSWVHSMHHNLERTRVAPQQHFYVCLTETLPNKAGSIQSPFFSPRRHSIKNDGRSWSTYPCPTDVNAKSTLRSKSHKLVFIDWLPQITIHRSHFNIWGFWAHRETSCHETLTAITKGLWLNFRF